MVEWILTGPIIVACQWNTETKSREKEAGYETLRSVRINNEHEVCVYSWTGEVTFRKRSSLAAYEDAVTPTWGMITENWILSDTIKKTKKQHVCVEHPVDVTMSTTAIVSLRDTFL